MRAEYSVGFLIAVLLFGVSALADPFEGRMPEMRIQMPALSPSPPADPGPPEKLSKELKEEAVQIRKMFDRADELKSSNPGMSETLRRKAEALRGGLKDKTKRELQGQK